MIRLSHLYTDLEDRFVVLSSDRAALLASRKVVEKALGDGKAYYGINTGFGILAHKRIDDRQVKKLQENLLISHAVGLGPLVPKPITKLMLDLKIQSLSLGLSGISEPVFDRLLYFSQHDLIPAVPSKGSLGASGDLAPLAHLSLPLIGKGQCWEGDKAVAADQVLKKHKLIPVTLEAKDGLALCNGTQLMSAYGAHVVHRALSLIKTADVLASLSLEALRGSLKPFDPRIHEARPHPGQRAVAQNVRHLMQGSQILESHENCDRVQDPYSIRCVPQVHGASRDALHHVAGILETEINSVTDNPLVFDNGDIVSGGNFHGQPLALGMDYAAMALAELANISERRTYLLLSGYDDLPPLLMKDTGINSGFMIPQYTAAALVSQNKVLTHPASTDSIPSCLGQEDHVSMGSISALKLLEVYENTVQVLAIEAFTASQALDFRDPLSPGKGVAAAHQTIRDQVAHKDADDLFRQDIDSCIDLIKKRAILAAAEAEVGPLS